MGTSYSNITVKADAARVIGFLKYARQTAYVSSTTNGFTIVCQQEIDPASLAEELSQAFRCLALAVLNNDDDVFMYDLWDGGRLLDQHASCQARDSGSGPQVIAPDEWTPDSDRQHRSECWESDDESGRQGDARVLCRAFGCMAAADEIDTLLQATSSDDSTYVLSHRYHLALARLLSIPYFIGSFESVQVSPEEGWTRVG